MMHAGRGPIERLRLLRESRVWADRAKPIGAILRDTSEEIERSARRLRGAGGAWHESCPERLALRTRVLGLHRGVLTIGADDASTRFEVDRWLRAGGEREVISSSSAAVKKIKIVLCEAGDASSGSEPGHFKRR